MCNIIFKPSFYFIVILLVGFRCKESNPVSLHKVSIRWENKKATAIIIRSKAITSPNDLQIILKGNHTPILGSIGFHPDSILFLPLVSFTPGLSYEIWNGSSIVDSFIIDIPNTPTPKLLNIYPLSDTLPENVLKFYLQFSESMQSGNALDHIKIIRNKKDTVYAPFLELQPELWNADQTLLTLWLDPGRIKRGLQPNLSLGAPIIAYSEYSLVIDTYWTDVNGKRLQDSYSKVFYTTERDSIMPDISKWKIIKPKANTRDELRIFFNETIDPILAKNAISINWNQKQISGQITFSKDDDYISFEPNQIWVKGNYRIEIESRLEDLAGNNLNHAFDRDINQQKSNDKKLYFLSFTLD